MFPGIDDLALQQRKLVATADSLSDAEYRAQFHHDISPAGWHLGHTLYVENFWLRESVLDKPLSPQQHLDFLPEKTAKATRGAKLPPKSEFIAECAAAQHSNLDLLKKPPPDMSSHPLLRDGYLVKFLAQHHAMHHETLCMALTERQTRRRAAQSHRVRDALRPAPAQLNGLLHFRAATRAFGGDDPHCFDNEKPRHRRRLGEFRISRRAVTNAEYLGFIRADGYTTTRLWSDEGLKWLREFMRDTDAPAPRHWRRDRAGRWFGVDVNGAHDLSPEAPVYGVNRHEACAFAHYARARLPTEFEWEAAAPKLEYGRVWEWCADAFQPYPDFRPFPYERYSQTWFDGAHYTLRGCSMHSSDAMRRRTMRNFHTPDKRYIFAGLRLAL